jgi:hypothetical protein
VADEVLFNPLQSLKRQRRKQKTIPCEFVLEELEPAPPYTKPMFGCAHEERASAAFWADVMAGQTIDIALYNSACLAILRRVA